MKFPVKVTFPQSRSENLRQERRLPFLPALLLRRRKAPHSIVLHLQRGKAPSRHQGEEIANGNQSIALTAKEATAALSIRDALDAFRRDTGRSFTALEAVTGFLDAMKQLPPGCGLTESVKAFARTLATIKPKLISEAVEEFITVRKPKAQSRRTASGRNFRQSMPPTSKRGCGSSPRCFRAITLAT